MKKAMMLLMVGATLAGCTATERGAGIGAGRAVFCDGGRLHNREFPVGADPRREGVVRGTISARLSIA